MPNKPDIWDLVSNIIRLLAVAGLGCFLGSIFEYRNWMKTASWLAKPLIKLGRLPEICGTAFLTAFVSNNAANSMIAGAYHDKKLSRREMILSGIANSYPAKVSHSLRIMFVVIFMLGIPGLLYFAIQFGTGLLRTVVILRLGRVKHASPELETPTLLEKKILSWPETLTKSRKRTQKLLVRMLLITVPIYALVFYLANKGIFKKAENYMPAFITDYFPSEVLTVMASRLGGFVAAAGTAFELQHSGFITTAQILIALFAGNIITNPIRMFRRNLPTALGVFPKQDGIWIVTILQVCRFISALVVIIILFVLMKKL